MLENGIYFNLPAEQYHAVDAISASQLKKIAFNLSSNNKKLDEESKSIIEGKLFHQYILERKITGWAIEPDSLPAADDKTKPWNKGDNRNCNAYKKWKEEQTLPILPDGIWDKCVEMEELIGDDLRQILQNGYSEVSVIWNGSDGNRYKARFDRLCETMFWDMKTTAMQAERKFKEHCINQIKYRNLDIQAVHYYNAAEQLKKLPVFGTAQQKSFIESLEVTPQPSFLFTRTDAPQYQILTFSKILLPQKWSLTENKIHELVSELLTAKAKFGNKPWISDMDSEINLTDEDFQREIVDSYYGA